jgi:N-acetylneuraminic acid mutarotase
MPTAREDFGSAVLNNKIYCFGGLAAPSVTTVIKKLEIYDPANNTWDTTKADMPDVKWSGDFGCAWNGKIYAVGGSKVMANGVPPYPICHSDSSIYEYDPVANSWSTKTPCPGGGGQYKECEVINGKIYLGIYQNDGDYRLASTKVATIWVYDIATDSWSTLGVSFPYAAFGQSMTKLGNRIHFIGGAFNGNHAELYALDI